LYESLRLPEPRVSPTRYRRHRLAESTEGRGRLGRQDVAHDATNAVCYVPDRCSTPLSAHLPAALVACSQRRLASGRQRFEELKRARMERMRESFSEDEDMARLSSVSCDDAAASTPAPPDEDLDTALLAPPASAPAQRSARRWASSSEDGEAEEAEMEDRLVEAEEARVHAEQERAHADGLLALAREEHREDRVRCPPEPRHGPAPACCVPGHAHHRLRDAAWHWAHPPVCVRRRVGRRVLSMSSL
jgi:hypothetical protein